ncbi:MAG: hypothetical protein A2201_07760, partial [Alicyclobacillus sp. RIFOXYA1_FULL_53_8]
AKAAPYVWPVWKQGRPEYHIVDLQSYIDEGFNLNTLIYSAIMYKVRAISATKLRAYKGDPEKPEILMPSHPLAKLVARPNPSQSFLEYQQLQCVYFNLSGNSFGLLDRPKRGGLPEAIYPLSPLRVYVIPGKKNELIGFLYVPEGKSHENGTPILPEDMMHVKLPNPGDAMEGMGYGLSPLSPMARSANVDNDVTDFLKKFFESGTMMNTYITFDVPMEEGVLAQSRERFMEIYGGYENWMKPAALDSGGKIQKFGYNFDEMGFEAIDERNESRILGPFGVPPILIGSRIGLMRSTYSNYEEARRACWEDTLVPEIRLYEADYQYYLQSDDGGFVAFDLSDVPALRKDMPALVEAAYKLWQMGEPRDSAYAIVGLEPVSNIPSGQISFVPLNAIPYDIGAEEAENTNVGAVEAEEDTEDRSKTKNLPVIAEKKSLSPEAKVAHWKANDRTATSWEPKFREAAVKAFEHDKRELLAMLNKGKRIALEQKATIDWLIFGEEWLRYLLAESGQAWRATFLPMIKGLIKDRGEQLATAFGMQFDVQNLFARDWFNNYTLKFATDIGETTKTDISKVLNQAQQEGWSVPTMQKNLTTLFDQYMHGNLTPDDFEWFEERMPAYRTEMIARTETLRASNAGSNQIYKDWGSEKKEWLSTRDNRTRPDHAEADGQVVGINE